MRWQTLISPKPKRSRQEIYLDIVYWGLLNTRNAALAGDADQCHVEADHLHNIPELLKSLEKEELHDFYWFGMKTNYIKLSKPLYVKNFKWLWKELEAATQRERF